MLRLWCGSGFSSFSGVVFIREIQANAQKLQQNKLTTTAEGGKSKCLVPRRLHGSLKRPLAHLLKCTLFDPQFCVSIAFNFFWDGCNTQEK